MRRDLTQLTSAVSAAKTMLPWASQGHEALWRIYATSPSTVGHGLERFPFFQVYTVLTSDVYYGSRHITLLSPCSIPLTLANNSLFFSTFFLIPYALESGSPNSQSFSYGVQSLWNWGILHQAMEGPWAGFQGHSNGVLSLLSSNLDRPSKEQVNEVPKHARTISDEPVASAKFNLHLLI